MEVLWVKNSGGEGWIFGDIQVYWKGKLGIGRNMWERRSCFSPEERNGSVVGEK